MIKSLFPLLMTLTTPSPADTPAVEVVMYHIRQPLADIRPIVIADVNQQLATLAPGIRQRTVLQSTNDPQWLLDWVVWDNLPNALAAAEAMPKHAGFASFMAEIDNMRGMWHALPINTKATLPAQPAVIEIVVYELQPDANASAFQGTYAAGLTSIPGYLGRHIYHDAAQPNRYIEYVAWASRAQAEAAQKLMEANPTVAAAFESVAKVELMELFVPLN